MSDDKMTRYKALDWGLGALRSKLNEDDKLLSGRGHMGRFNGRIARINIVKAIRILEEMREEEAEWVRDNMPMEAERLGLVKKNG